MTTTRLFKSTDPGAPILNGTVGSLTALLKACLVGASGVAYGTDSAAKLAAGWTVAFEDVANNKIVLQNSAAAGGTGYFVRILDDGSGTSASAANAHISGYSSMSDIDTGNDATPINVSGWPGARVEKSSAANSSATVWVLIADERTCYLNTQAGDRTNANIYGFGDYQSFVPGFSYNFFVAGGGASTAASARGSAIVKVNPINAAGNNFTSGGCVLALMRSIDSSPGNYFSGIAALGGDTAYGGSLAAFAYSTYLAGDTQCCPAQLCHTLGVPGVLRGLYLPMQRTHGLTLPAYSASAMSGSQIAILAGNPSYQTGNDIYYGAALIESTLPWA